MILARHREGDDVYGSVSVATSASAVAAHRGDVTTVMAAAAVRLRAEKRDAEARSRFPSQGTVRPPAAR